MKKTNFDVDVVIKKAKAFLAPQGPLKEFVAQNPLRGFLNLEFHEALRRSGSLFGAWSYLPLGFYRKAYADGLISQSALDRSLMWNIEDDAGRERTRADLFEYPEGSSVRPSSLVRSGIRVQWETFTGENVLDKTLPVMFRLLGAYLDQGISIWRMPVKSSGFLAAVTELVSGSMLPFKPFDQQQVRDLMNHPIDDLISKALERLVGDQKNFERYVLDIIFAHPGWSSMISNIEEKPQSLALERKITLKEVIAVNLLADIGFLTRAFGPDFSSLAHYGPRLLQSPLDVRPALSRIDFIKSIWHEAWEWGLYEQSIALVLKLKSRPQESVQPTAQAVFCIDDRECSIRRYLEEVDSSVMTFGCPGFFGIDFMYQCADDLYPNRQAPIVLSPKHLVRASFEVVGKSRTPRIKRKLMTLDHASHTMFRGWFITQILGLTAAFRLAFAVFRPVMTQTTASSLTRLNENISINLERANTVTPNPDGYLHGFTIEEMAEKIKMQLEAMGLIKNFAPIVLIFAHGSTSTNNTHFSAYDCGACSGKPGTPNARVFARMANHPGVRKLLVEKGILIHEDTQFIAALHDTTRDEVKYLDLRDLAEETRKNLKEFAKKMTVALRRNAKERCRRFELVDPEITVDRAAAEVLRRSVAMFEPRPELTHTGNAIAVVGRRQLTAGGFFDRRAFLHSYDPTIDFDGEILRRILGAVVPVCGGINLCYYFSKLDDEVYGAGTKLPHNIIGLIGVCNGVEGDIQTGLPRQMIEFHDPIRLQLIVEQKPKMMLKVLEKSPEITTWFKNNWMRLVVVDPDGEAVWLWKDGAFSELNRNELPEIAEKMTQRECFEGSSQDVPLANILSGRGAVYAN